MSFCTAITCMDGRIQLPVINYLQKRFGAEYVDTITEAGPNKIFADGEKVYKIESMLKRLHISIDHHKSVGIAVVGHHDCARNPTGREEQVHHLKLAVEKIKPYSNNLEVIALWVDENWEVEEVDLRV